MIVPYFVEIEVAQFIASYDFLYSIAISLLTVIGKPSRFGGTFFVSPAASFLLVFMLRKVSLALLVILYVAAGINHFLHPGFYEAIMPPYLPGPRALVYVSGVIEVFLGLLLLFARTRLWATRLIAVMLVVFVPVHVYMLQQAYAVPGYQTTVTAAWVRLLLQPVLVFWVLWHGSSAGSFGNAQGRRHTA